MPMSSAVFGEGGSTAKVTNAGSFACPGIDIQALRSHPKGEEIEVLMSCPRSHTRRSVRGIEPTITMFGSRV
jgi:hypothetical protein